MLLQRPVQSGRSWSASCQRVSKNCAVLLGFTKPNSQGYQCAGLGCESNCTLGSRPGLSGKTLKSLVPHKVSGTFPPPLRSVPGATGTAPATRKTGIKARGGGVALSGQDNPPQIANLSRMGRRPTEMHENPLDRRRAVGTMGSGALAQVFPVRWGWVFDPAPLGNSSRRAKKMTDSSTSTRPPCRGVYWSQLRKPDETGFTHT